MFTKNSLSKSYLLLWIIKELNSIMEARKFRLPAKEPQKKLKARVPLIHGLSREFLDIIEELESKMPPKGPSLKKYCR